jgi:hypothetical protein
MAKSGKVDSKVRVGGSAVIDHGARGGGVGKHSMSENVEHVNRVPSDLSEFDQHHGNATAETGDHYGSSKE